MSAANGAGRGRERGLPEASLAESLQFVVAGLLPSLVRGLFSPRPGAMKLLTRLDADRRTVEVLAKLRRNHPGAGVKLLGGRIVTLWGAEAIREVLDRSADVYDSGSGAKGKGMAHFQPEALTVSHGEEWKDRRAFAESVLAAHEPVHPSGARFAAVVADELERMDLRGSLTWPEMERLFDRITLRVIFGDRARDDRELTQALEKLMGEANRLVGVGSPTDDFHELYGRIERHMVDPEPRTLLAHIADAPQTPQTRVVHQVPHWIFAMRDTLAANVMRALAVIVALPDVHERVKEELEGVDLSDPADLQRLTYLEGCLQETMRLWPTVPLIAREATRETTLAGEKIDEGTQVMLVNAFNHRDAEEIPDADRLRPERWADGGDDIRFNHLSHGTQDCPGAHLVSLIGKAVLAGFLNRHAMTLNEPELDPDAPLPHMLDFYAIRLDARPVPVG